MEKLSLIDQVREAASEVYQILGPKYYERVYEEALTHEFRLRGLPYERQKNCELLYKRYTVGTIRIDIVVKGELIVECKSVKKLNESHRNQVKAYCISSGIKKGILLNFPKDGDSILIKEIEPAPVEKKESKRREKENKNLFHKIKNAADEVCDILGTEFIYQSLGLEIYKEALGIEFRLNKIPYSYRTLDVFYKNQVIDKYSPGFVVKDKYLVNLCSTEEIGDTEEEEIKYALDLSGLNEGFVINFPPDSIIAKVKKIRRPH